LATLTKPTPAAVNSHEIVKKERGLANQTLHTNITQKIIFAIAKILTLSIFSVQKFFTITFSG